ncbi:lysophospholipid acyltransferase family protein [Desulfosarcina ovata]|nr:lysophospholipid acyltransferase family protein [Desulfosarcina ovata]
MSLLKKILSRIPTRHVIWVGRCLGMLAYFLDGRHRSIVNTNLKFTNPLWSRGTIRQLAGQVFQNLGATFFSILQISCFTRRQILDAVKVRGEDNVLKAFENSGGAIVISAHLGNWEMGLLFCSCYMKQPMVLVVRPIEFRVIDRWLNRFRTRFGNVTINKKNALPHLKQALRQGSVVGLMIDQEPKHKDGVDVDFMGRTVSTTPAVALMARRYGVPVFPTYCIREKNGDLTFVMEPPLNLQKTADIKSDLQANTQTMTHAIEKAVRAYPDQWFWCHKRWKKYYPHLYKDLLVRQKRRAKKRAMRMAKP